MARLEILKTYKLYIDGKFPRSESGRHYAVKSKNGKVIANACLSSRKDLRDAIVAARKAQSGWAARSAYNRGQILYRIAEMLEGRKAQFTEELLLQGYTAKQAASELQLCIDRLVHYAGWSDKYQAIFSSVNPVESAHFNFSMPEAMGVIGILAEEKSALLGLVSLIAPAIVGGNTCIVLGSEQKPLCASTFGEVLHASDVPAGVVNILTGSRAELIKTFASHMDVNALVFDASGDELYSIQTEAAANVKRCVRVQEDCAKADSQGPYHILNTQEIKTTWHPIGV